MAALEERLLVGLRRDRWDWRRGAAARAATCVVDRLSTGAEAGIGGVWLAPAGLGAGA